MKYNMCWDITSKCNENCRFCYRNKVKKDLGIEENKKILQDIYKSKIINKITICGGEPLMYDGLFQLLDGVERPENISLSIVTNGIKLATYNQKENKFDINVELIEKFLKHFKWICFSIDAFNQDIEALVGRNKYHVERIRTILNYLNDCNKDINLKINTLICKQNYLEIPNLYSFISEYSFIKRWKLFRYLGDNNLADINDYYNIDDEQFKKVTDFIKNIKNDNLRIDINDFDAYEGTYIMLKQDGTVEISNKGQLKEVLDLKKDNIRQIENVKEFNIEKHRRTHGVKL